MTDREFKTGTLSVAAAAILMGRPVKGIVPLPGRYRSPRGMWVFDFDEELAKMDSSYRKGLMRVEPKAFAIALAEARNKMFEWVNEQQES